MAKRRQTIINEMAGYMGMLWRADNPLKARILSNHESKIIFEALS